MKEVTLYADGACSGNPGPGGWAAILIYNGFKKEISGGEPNTTNNRMELLSIIKGLQALKEPCDVSIFSDSAYVVNAVNQGWLIKWNINGWKTADKKSVANQDLWKVFMELIDKHDVTFNKVKGHNNVELNERCDILAKGEIVRSA